MYYNGYKDDVGLQRRIGRATSMDGVNWAKDTVNNPVLDMGTSGQWDEDGVLIGSVIKEGPNDYIMYYAGFPATTHGIGVATSTDGVNWSRYGSNPVLDESDFTIGGDRIMALPYTIKLSDGSYLMYFEGLGVGADFTIFGATSPDGYSWTALNSGNAVMTGSIGSWCDNVANPKVMEVESGKYVMGFNGAQPSGHFKLGFATSTDKVNWTAYEENPVLQSSSGDWDYRIENVVIAKDDIGTDTIRMWYFGYDNLPGAGTASVGYATCDQNALKYVFSNKWDDVGSPIKDTVEDGGSTVASLKGDGTHNCLITNKIGYFSNFVFEGKAKMTLDNVQCCDPEFSVRYSDNDSRYIMLMRGETVNDLQLRRYESGSEYINAKYSFDYGVQYYKFKYIFNGEKIDLWLDNTHLVDYTDTGTGITSGKIGLHNFYDENAAYFDDVRIRKYASLEPMATIGSQTTFDTTPPICSNGSPSGTLSHGTTSTNISLSTNENATCKYSTTAGTAYADMANTFSATGTTSHSQTISGLVDGQSYTYYIRCQDTIGNSNLDDYSISFSIGSSPVNYDPIGTLDSADQSQITGWAYDTNAGSNPIDVHIYIDGTIAGSATANQPRQDLVDDGVCPNPNHGFTFTTPSLLIGEHTVTVYAINQPEGINPELIGSPKTFNVSSSDTTPPTGSVLINNGDEKTSSQNVNLSIPANDPSGLSEMKISNSNNFSSTITETYNTIKTFILSPIDGIKTVYVWFKDNIGNWNAEPYSDTITLDTASPTISNISISNITASAAKISFETNEPSISHLEYGLTSSYGMSTDPNTSPVSSYQLQITSLSSDTTYHFKIISKDVLENESNSIDQTFKTIGLPDTVPPSHISNLSALSIGQTSLDLNWTSPGDDGNNGIAAEYDLRYSLFQITTGNWNLATQLTAEPSPLVSGTLQLYTVVGLDSGTIYYFAIKTGDEVPNWSGLSNVKQTETLPYVPPTCISFTYSAWSECQPNNTQSRTVSTSSPEGCAGGNPILSRSCTYIPPTCTSFTYSLWGECQANDTQYRTVSTSSPSGCTGGNPILSQSCDYPDPVPPFCTSFTYSLWGECQADDTQYRTVSTSSPSGCTGGNPILFQICTYVPPTCISFTYSSWQECQPDNTQSRTVSTSSPDGCAGGNPILLQSCTYVPSGGGGGGGGGGTVPDTTPPNQPSNFKAIPADSQITLTWKNPSDSDFVRVKLLRKENSAPLSHNDSSAVIVYEGNKEQYTNIELNNNTTYYYSIFAYDKKPNYSEILTISAKPEKGKTSIEIPNESSYIEGTLLKTSDSFKIYIIINQKKKWIPTPEVFETLGYQWTSITIIDKNELTLIPDYEDNLIRAINDYKVYLIVNGIKRHIPNPEIFLNYGFEWNDVKDVSLETINQYTTSLLIKESKKEEIYYLCPERKIKRWLRSPEIFLSYNNKWEDVQVISKYEMDHYPESNLIKLYNSNDVYSIEGNQKKLIKTVEEFEREGLDWGRVMGVNGVEIGWWGN